jgi:hypothetical protein
MLNTPLWLNSAGGSAMVLPAEKRGVQGLGTGGTGVGDCASPTTGNAANTDAQINILLTPVDIFIEVASLRDSYPLGL